MALNKRMVAVIAAAMVALIVTATTLTSTQVMADMLGFFKRYEVHLSPEVSGQVLKGGEPVPNTPVYRELFYEKRMIDKTHTDQQGRFHFQEKSIKSNAPGKLFGETHVTQVITADYEDTTFLLWRTSVSRIEPSKVLTEKLSELNCDLENEQKMFHFEMHEHPSFTHNISSICRW